MEQAKGELHVEYSEISDAYIVLDKNDNVVACHCHKADAAELVRRWNAFEGLLAACEDMAKEWDFRGKHIYQTGAPAAVFAIKAAIAAAKGE